MYPSIFRQAPAASSFQATDANNSSMKAALLASMQANTHLQIVNGSLDAPSLPTNPVTFSHQDLYLPVLGVVLFNIFWRSCVLFRGRILLWMPSELRLDKELKPRGRGWKTSWWFWFRGGQGFRERTGKHVWERAMALECVVFRVLHVQTPGNAVLWPGEVRFPDVD